MKYIYSVLFLFGIHFCLYAQTIKGVVVDEKTKAPVPYANIVLPEKNIGVSATADGKFEFDLQNETGLLIFSSIGYEEKRLDISILIDNPDVVIMLSQKATELNEVIVENKRKQYSGSKSLGLPKKAKVSTGLPFGNEICGYIKNTKYKKGLLKSVSLDLQKDSKADYLATYNVKFYEYDENLKKPGRELYSNNLIIYPENKTYKLKIPVDSLAIEFPENGICIGIEIINTQYTGKLKSMALIGPRINFTHTPMEILSWSRYRNKEWHVDTHKSRVRKDFINFLVGIDVVTEK